MEDLLKLGENTAKAVDHPGCVERVLSFLDRRLIFNALAAYLTEKDKRSDFKHKAREKRIHDALRMEDVDEYFDSFNAALVKRANEYNEAMAVYKKSVLEGKPVKRIGDQRPPKVDSKEEAGPAQTFHIEAKLDVLIQDALKAMQWGGLGAAAVSSISAAYGFKDED